MRPLVSTLGLILIVLTVTHAKTNYAYVANNSAGTVSVFNIANNTAVTTITVGSFPYAVAVDQPGKFAYVTNSGDGTVSVISTSTNKVVSTVPVPGAFTIALSPSGKTAYVGTGSAVAVLNTATKKVTTSISVPNPIGLAVTSNGAFVYVVSSSPGNVVVISTLTNAIVATIPVGTNIPISVVISPDGQTAYVTNYNANTVSVVRTGNNTVANTIPVSAGPFDEAISPDGHWLYVAQYNAGGGNLVTVIDTATQTIATTVVVGTGPEYIGFSQDSAFAYVSNITSNNVSVINTGSKTVVNTVSVGKAPVGVGVMGTMKVTTVAGGYVGDKGPANAAAIGAPYSSVIDGSGNRYISDVELHRIRKVDSAGNITTYAGNGICGYNGENVLSAQALICGPNGLALDVSGNLVFADGGNGRIRMIDKKSHKITTIAGNGLFGYNPAEDGGPALNSQINQPFQITYDASGNLFFDEVGACVVRELDTAGIIHTVAGTGTCGYNGDNMAATSAELNLPRGVAFDSIGNLYIGDTVNHYVRRVDKTGKLTNFAGIGKGGFTCTGGPATSAKVGNPRGLNVVNNVLYIGNGGSLMCTVDLATNNITTYAGSTSGYDGDGHALLASKFFAPTFVLFDSSGNPVFDDAFNGRLRQGTGGVLATIAGGYIGPEGVSATKAAFGFIEALAIDSGGNLYIADESGNRVRKVSGGKVTTVAGNGISGYAGDGKAGNDLGTELYMPQGVAVDSSGNVFIADTFNKVVREVTKADGKINTIAANANFSFLLQMATDSANNVYVADNGACVIWKIDTSKNVTVAAGVLNACGYNGDNISATTAELSGPYGVTFDANNNMYIADNGNNRVREVVAGTISTIAGNGTCGYTGDGGSATAGELCPNSVAVDKSGTVYVADFSALRIREIKGGIITTFAGSGYGFNGDKLWPLYTSFDDPVAVAVDSKGAVYEVDDSNHRVRKIQ